MSGPADLATAKPPRIGMVGGGQLARMTTQAATAMGIAVTVMDPDPRCPAAQVGATIIPGAPDDLDALMRLSEQVDVVTFDHELIPLEHVRALEQAGVLVAPGSDVAEMAFDKAAARRRFRDEGMPIPRFEVVRDPHDIVAFGEQVGWPVVVKAARGGYDGRGVVVVESSSDAADAVTSLGPDMIAEEFVAFDGELAVMVARRAGGETAAYPPVSTIQADGMCVEVAYPADVSPVVAQRARSLVASMADRLGLVGVMAVELFVVGEQLLINEVATRPHNSAHLTIEANATSQFEQHARAVLDLPLGSTEPCGEAAVMVNVVGDAAAIDPAQRLASALAVAEAHVHLYGKQSRPGRKLGHVTTLGASVERARASASLSAAILNGESGATSQKSEPSSDTGTRETVQ